MNIYQDNLHSSFHAVFKIQHLCCTHSTSQFGLATLQVLSIHLWLVATMLA